MKKIRIAALTAAVALLMSSCYTSKVYHGNVTENTPVLEVASKANPILLFGLLPLKGASQKASDVVGDKKNFVVKTGWTFVDGFLNSLTLGIYSPTTTSYYLPVSELE